MENVVSFIKSMLECALFHNDHNNIFFIRLDQILSRLRFIVEKITPFLSLTRAQQTATTITCQTFWLF